MSKKILAGILAAASMLSVSAVAFAADSDASDASSAAATTQDVSGAAPATGVSYGVDAIVSYGTVDAVLPATSLLAKNSVVVNPYGAAVKTYEDDGTTLVATNTNFIASPYYKVENNDTEGGLKVIATVSVKKATGLVIKQKYADAVAAGVKGADAVGASTNAEVCTDWDPLVDFAAIKTTTDKTDPKNPVINYASGGEKLDVAKQKMNTAIWLVGGTSVTDIEAGVEKFAVAGKPKAGDTFVVDFAPKGENGGTLIWLGKAATGTPKVGYFTTMGELNPEIDKENYAWGKEALSLSIVLKLVPTVEP